MEAAAKSYTAKGAAAPAVFRCKSTVVFERVLTGLFLLYTFLPICSVLLFSLAGKWTGTILPEVWSVEAYINIASNPEFWGALGRSLIMGVSVSVIDIFVVLTALLGVTLMDGDRAAGWMEMVAIIPLALPGVTLALGSVLFYGKVMPVLLGTPALLILTAAAFGIPFVFWTLQNAFRNMPVRSMYEAACTMGATTPQFIIRILMPNLRSGMLAAGIMAFTSAFNDYALTLMITGAGWNTLPLMQSNYAKIDGHQTNAIAIVSIVITFVLAVSVARIKRSR